MGDVLGSRALGWRTLELCMLRFGQYKMGDLLGRGCQAENCRVNCAQAWPVQGWVIDTILDRIFGN